MSGGTSANLPTSREAELIALASRVLRLVPDRRDPEAFHIEKSELASALRRLARSMAA